MTFSKESHGKCHVKNQWGLSTVAYSDLRVWLHMLANATKSIIGVGVKFSQSYHFGFFVYYKASFHTIKNTIISFRFCQA